MAMGAASRPYISAKLRGELLDRAGYQCAICHRMFELADDGHGENGIIIYIAEIAHIIPVRSGGERGGEPRPADINDIGNLIPLCPTDHTTIDKPGLGGRLWPAEKLRRLKAEHEAWVAFERVGQQARQRVAPSPGRAPLRELRLGEVVTVARYAYRVLAASRPGRVDGTFTVDRSPDGNAIRCAAYGYAETGPAGHVWLRLVASRSGSPDGQRWRAALTEEAALLASRLPARPGLPKVLALETSPSEALLLTELPSATSLQDRFGDAGTAEEAMRALFSGLGALCEGLSALHCDGLAHGALDPATILVDRRGRLALRDLGRAASPARSRRDGPDADITALAAIIYRLVTGFPPAVGGPPVLATALNPAVPEQAAAALDRALRGGLRDVRSLGQPIRGGRRERT